MAEVFISYKSERRKAAEHFAEVLQRHGYTVWFDYELVKGRDFAEQIETRIKAAKAVVTLWCSLAIGSRWVKEEAHLAQRLGIYTPVKIESVDPPFGYLLDDTINLSGWDGDPRSPDLDQLLNDLEHKVGRAAVPDRRALMEYQSQWRRFGALSLKAFAIAPFGAAEASRAALKPEREPQTNPTIAPPQPPSTTYEDARLRLVRTYSGHSNVLSVAFSPDGRTALSGSIDSTLMLWDVSAGVMLRTFSGHASAVYSVALSPDGRTVVSVSGDNTAKLWDISSGQVLRTFIGHTDNGDARSLRSVTSVAFSPDGHNILTGSLDNTLKLWDVSTGRVLRTLTGHTHVLKSVTFSPDGRKGLSGSGDSTLKLWDLSGGIRRTVIGSMLRTFTGHSDYVNSVAFSPDGRTALSGSSDRTLRLWSVATGNLIRIFAGHLNAVQSVAFSPDGRFVGSGDFGMVENGAAKYRKGQIKLWVTATGAEICSQELPDAAVRSVAFSPDGRFLLSGSTDVKLRLWDVSEWTQAP